MWQVIINGPGYFDTQYELPDGVTSLGRADENDIVLSGDLVSRRHARFHVKGDDINVEDLGSRNGSKLNGSQLTGTMGVKVGDVVSVGENTLVLRQPAMVENARTEVVTDTGMGGVHRFAAGVDLATAVVLSKDVNDNFILRALDNVAPFSLEVDAPVAEGDKTPRPIPYPSLAVLYRTAEKLSTARTQQEFLDFIADLLMERANGTTAVVLLKQPGGTFVPAAVRHRGQLAKGEVPVSDAIIEEALKKRSALAVANVRDDERFANRDSVVLYGVDQVLCVPMGEPDAFAGVLYVNCTRQDPSSLESLLDLFNAEAHLIASGVEKFQLRERSRGEERLRKALERFHGAEVVERRIGELAGAPPRSARLDERTVTALYANLGGTSGPLKRAEQVALGELLLELYTRATGLVFSFEGTLQTFLGDQVVALFGTPYSKTDDAVRAVRAALAIQDDWKTLMNKRPPKERCPLRIGLNTGKAWTGAVGSEQRFEHVAFGEALTLAAEVCESADAGQVLITGKTLAAIGARFDVTPLGERALSGAKKKVPVFELLHEDVGANTSPGV